MKPCYPGISCISLHRFIIETAPKLIIIICYGLLPSTRMIGKCVTYYFPNCVGAIVKIGMAGLLQYFTKPSFTGHQVNTLMKSVLMPRYQFAFKKLFLVHNSFQSSLCTLQHRTSYNREQASSFFSLQG